MTNDEMRRTVAKAARDEALGILELRREEYLVREDVEADVYECMWCACVVMFGSAGMRECYLAWQRYLRVKHHGGFIDHRSDDDFSRDLRVFVDAAYAAAGGE